MGGVGTGARPDGAPARHAAGAGHPRARAAGRDRDRDRVPVAAGPVARITTGRWRTDNGAPDTGTQQLWSAVLHVPPVDPVKRGTAAGADVRAVAAHSGASRSRPRSTADTREADRPAQLELPPADRSRRARSSRPSRSRPSASSSPRSAPTLSWRRSWTYPLLAPGRRPPGYVPLGLVEYQHTAALGRDHFVRTVHVGYLCGTCHRAVVDLTVERLPLRTEVVGNAPGGGALFSAKGYLLKTMTVIVQEPVVDYEPLCGRPSRTTAVSCRSRTSGSRRSRLGSRCRDLDEGAFWLQRPDGTPLCSKPSAPTSPGTRWSSASR